MAIEFTAAEVSKAKAASTDGTAHGTPFFGPRKANAPVDATYPAGIGWSFDLNKFKRDYVHLPALTPDLRHREEGVAPTDRVEFRKETVDGLIGFTKSHMLRIIRLRNMPDPHDPNDPTRNAYTALLEQDRNTPDGTLTANTASLHSYEQDFLNLVTSPDSHNPAKVVFDEAKFNSVMQHAEAWEAAQQMANVASREILASIGAHAEIRPHGNRTDPNDPIHNQAFKEIDFNIDQGPINTGVRSLLRWLRSPTRVGGRAQELREGHRLALILGGIDIGGGVGGTFANILRGAGAQPAGIAIGAGAVAAGIGLAYLSRSGVRLSLEADPDALARSQQDYLRMRNKALYGIDPHDFEMNNNRLGLAPGVDTQGSTRIGLALSEAIKLIGLRAMYFEDLKVPPQNMEALPEQFIYAPRDSFRMSTKEETGVNMDDDIHRRFTELGGIFNPGGVLNAEATMQRYFRAQSEMITQRLQAAMEKNLPEITDPNNIAALDAKITARTGGNDAPEVRRQTEEAQQRRRAFEGDRTSTETQHTTFTNYDSANTANREALQTATDAVTDIISGLTGSAGPYANAPAAIAEIDQVLDRSGAIPTSSITGITDEDGNVLPIIRNLATTRADFVTAATSARITGRRLTPAQTTRELANIETDADTEIARLTTILQGAKTRIRTAQRAVITARETLSNNEQVRAINTEFQTMTDAYTEVTGITITPTVMNRWLLRRDLTPILDMINRWNTANPAVGWPDTENNNADRRMLVIRAMEEARARAALNANPNSTASGGTWEGNFDLLRAPTSPYVRLVSDHQLRVLDRTEIRALGIPAVVTDAQIDEAQEWARLRETTRLDQINAARAAAQTGITTEDRAIRTVADTVRGELEQLQTIRDVAGFHANGEVLDRTTAAYADPEARAYLFGGPTPAQILARQGKHQGVYSDEEVNAANTLGVPYRIGEFLDILTNYQQSTTRGQDFQRILTRFEEIAGGRNQLAELFGRAFFPGVIITTYPQFMLQWETTVNTRGADMTFLTQGMTNFVRLLVGRGMAI